MKFANFLSCKLWSYLELDVRHPRWSWINSNPEPQTLDLEGIFGKQSTNQRQQIELSTSGSFYLLPLKSRPYLCSVARFWDITKDQNGDSDCFKIERKKKWVIILSMRHISVWLLGASKAIWVIHSTVSRLRISKRPWLYNIISFFLRGLPSYGGLRLTQAIHKNKLSLVRLLPLASPALDR